MQELEDIEIQLLLEGIYRYYGFDFRNYAMASLKRRIWNVVRAERLSTISELLARLLHEPDCMERFLLGLTVNVTSMFRDPEFYRAFRAKAVPLLKSCPFIRIWHAGCSTGEEVYSLAILLHEEGLYSRCRIYATDMNEQVLRQAKTGVFPLEVMQKYTQLYLKAGGKQSFSQYYTVAYDSVIFRSFLKEKIVFSMHNLVTDTSFNEFNVILCRNVLIYFNRQLQNQVHKLLYESLAPFGIVGLGKGETLLNTPCAPYYKTLDGSEKLYQRVA
ncbi:protein-glutamate O-methyltransferase CheR [Pseudanabaena sp. FACHB-2040]|uniref:CheR family methyltransferase n=1 Tax=Pseudanabaena sp. FACHB-2040 TaxID=2692859 RepID=UPI001686A24F|nr:protein-glutamate O-methyltransferase CheR [Pseudanabaena sp. FACHB-2040]